MPHANVLAVAYALEIQFYDLDQNEPFAKEMTKLTSQNGTIQQIQFHPNGDLLAVAYIDGVD